MSALLELQDVVVGRSRSNAGAIGLALRQGEVLAVMGPNGAGKSTLLNAVAGLVPATRGRILVDDKVVERPTPARMLALGVSLVPQQRHLFPNFTVLENIRAGGYARRQHEGVLEAQQDKVLELFPTLRVLGNTKASSLSGGEQQMVAVARAMMTAPKVLLLDEPSHGLAPMVVADLVRTLSQMVEHDGGSVIIAEQNAEAVASIADRYLLLDATAAPRNLSRAEATTSEMAAAYFGRTRKEHDDK